MFTSWLNKLAYLRLAGAVEVFGKMRHFSFLRLFLRPFKLPLCGMW